MTKASLTVRIKLVRDLNLFERWNERVNERKFLDTCRKPELLVRFVRVMADGMFQAVKRFKGTFWQWYESQPEQAASPNRLIGGVAGQIGWLDFVPLSVAEEIVGGAAKNNGS
ncbi:hypothetical protein BDW74DRAFT_183556 [Aspergillus multicolor]|uniref:uncharacterized protein n=1 Tax=Aspergillus multicolor TaxID=41759 RepID=UPI003CCD3E3B